MSDEQTPSEQEGGGDQMAAAKETAGQAAEQAKEFAGDAAAAIQALEPKRLMFLGALVLFFLCTTFFNMVAFSVDAGAGEANTIARNMAQEMADNAWISVLRSGWAGALAWALVVAAISIVVWSAMTKSEADWIPKVELACAGGAAVLMLLLLLISFGDSVSDEVTIRVKARLLGFWLPFLAIGAAAYLAAMRFMESGGMGSGGDKPVAAKQDQG